MKVLITKLTNSIRTTGLAHTLYRCLRYPVVRLKTAADRKRIFVSEDTAEVFSKIHALNWWGNRESVSGSGSTLAYTENLRRELPALFERFSIRRVYDAPCGDFNWMGGVVEATDIDYLGGDIVPCLIERNNSRHSSNKIRFSVANIITDPFPRADLWICRDCLIHFSFRDVFAALSNFVASDIPFILTTTHVNDKGFENFDIRTGDARAIDLFSAPFFLSRDCHSRIADWLPPDAPREMVLFHRDQVAAALPKMRAALGGL